MSKELTKSQKALLGITFTTHKQGLLTIVGISTGVTSKGVWDNKVILTCSICSKDTELFPEGSIKSHINSLKRGSTPCGCSKRPFWDKRQYTVRVNRLCTERGFNFLGFVGEWKGIQTRIKVHNPESNNTWQSMTIANLLAGNGDPVVGRLKTKASTTVDDSTHIKDFIAAGLTTEHTFTRSDRLNSEGSKNYWKYTCPVCVNDEFVKAGLCDGVFESTTAELKRGGKGCRCSRNIRWTQGQREYQINKILKTGVGIFQGWVTEEGCRISANSKFNWMCSQGHSCSTKVCNFIDQNDRCPTCFKESGAFNGYFPDRTEEQDKLYVIDFNSCIKVGRAFDINRRIGTKGTGLLKSSNRTRNQLTILKILTGTHREIYDLEQAMHQELRERGFQYTDETWSTELFTLDSKDMIFILCDYSGMIET